MGTWGPGNFDSDDALEILEEVSNVFQPEISGFMESPRVGYEDLAAVVACIAVENALVQECGLPSRGPEDAGAIRDEVLEIFDDEANQMITDLDSLAARREAIEFALNRMLKNADETADG